MTDEDKAKEQLITELVELRKKIAELKNSETQHNQTEEALREAETRYRGFFENVVEGLFHTTLDGRFITVNPSLAHIFGYESPEEFLSKISNVKQLYVDPSRRDELVHLIQTQEVVTGFETQLYRKDSSVIWISLNVRALRDTSDRVVALEGTLLNISELKRSEKLSNALYDINICVKAEGIFIMVFNIYREEFRINSHEVKHGGR